jgi:ElaB/YqjD/DUF883 family membrane-anchored ribosome-binding protein
MFFLLSLVCIVTSYCNIEREMADVKELVNLAELITTISSETALVIDSRIRTAVDSKIGDIKQHLSNYLAYMQAVQLAVVSSTHMWALNTLVLNKCGIKDDLDKFKSHCTKFEENATALVKPLTYFTQLIPAKPGGTTLGDVASSLELMIRDFHELSVSALESLGSLESKEPNDSNKGHEVVKARLISGGIEEVSDVSAIAIKIGGSETWIGGFQVSDLLTRHIAKLEVMKQSKTMTSELLDHEIQNFLGSSVDEFMKNDDTMLLKLARLAGIDRGVRMIKWVGDSVSKYIVEHAVKYKQFIDLCDQTVTNSEFQLVGGAEDNLTDISTSLLKTYLSESRVWYDQLFQIDGKILLGMGIDEFKKLSSIRDTKAFTAAVDELKNQSALAVDERNRAAVMSEINNINNELADICETIELALKSSSKSSVENFDVDNVGKVNDATIEFLEKLVGIEMEMMPTLSKLETLYNSAAQLLGELTEQWRRLIGPDKSTCIQRTGVIIKALVRLSILKVLAKNKFNSGALLADIKISDNHPNVELYDKSFDLTKLKTVISSLM